MDEYYTHAMWKVKPDSEEQFVEAWKAIGDVFLSLPDPPGRGTLIQSLSDPTLFYSFGPWPSLEAVQAMRENPRAQEVLRRVASLCEEATPGSYRVVMQMG